MSEGLAGHPAQEGLRDDPRVEVSPERERAHIERSLVCGRCGEPFLATRPWHRYHANRCRAGASRDKRAARVRKMEGLIRDLSKLAERGVEKLVPDAAMLAMAFKRAHYVAAVNRRLAKMQKAEQAKAEQATVPADLADQIRARLADDPALPWDAAVADLVRPRGKKPKA